MEGKFTIGIVTFNNLFYSRLQLLKLREHSPDGSYQILVYDNGSTDGTREFWGSLPESYNVKLFTSLCPNDKSHGQALNYLVEQTRTPVFCALDADAFPVSNEWWTKPMRELNEKVVLAGIGRGWGHTLRNYVHPSYLFGVTEFLKKHSFEHRWPADGDKYDTGEKLTEKAYKYGYEVKFFKERNVDFDGRFKPKPCDYAGLVWHIWWSSRKVVSPGLAGREFEPDYHDYCQALFREKYDLDF